MVALLQEELITKSVAPNAENTNLLQTLKLIALALMEKAMFALNAGPPKVVLNQAALREPRWRNLIKHGAGVAKLGFL